MKETTAGYLVLLVHTLQADLLATQQLVLTIAESSPENAGWLEERLHARAESARLVAEGFPGKETWTALGYGIKWPAISCDWLPTWTLHDVPSLGSKIAAT